MAAKPSNVVALKKRPAPAADDLQSWCVNELPFVKDGNTWAVAPTGDYERDGKTGREYAFAFMDFERRKPAELRGSGIPEIRIIVDMIAAGDDNEIVRMFFFTLVECSAAAWEPECLTAARAYYVEKDRRFAEFKASEKREEFERRSAASKKAWKERRKKSGNDRAAETQRGPGVIPALLAQKKEVVNSPQAHVDNRQRHRKGMCGLSTTSNREARDG